MSLRSSSGVDSTYCSSDEGGSSSAEAQRQHAAAAANETVEELREALQGVNLQFLKIEKFANLNIRACYKILKKHDKLIPATVCCRYYLERLHQQPWIRNDHSAVFVVQMADLFSKLRGVGNVVVGGGLSPPGSGSTTGPGIGTVTAADANAVAATLPRLGLNATNGGTAVAATIRNGGAAPTPGGVLGAPPVASGGVSVLFGRLPGPASPPAATAATVTAAAHTAAQGSGPKGGPGVQDFVRTTRKYWVATEDVSGVKQAIGQHLPVFLVEREKSKTKNRNMNGSMWKRDGDVGGDPTAAFFMPTASDSQMTSSVYLVAVRPSLIPFVHSPFALRRLS